MDWYAKALNELTNKPRAHESEVCTHLITPLLMEVLGFSISEIDMERQEGRRPDYVCTRSGSRYANVIVEAKRLNTDLCRRTTQNFASSPVGQLRRYLNTFPAADEGTWGVVTNGTQWMILRRTGGRVPTTAIGEPVEARSLARITELLSPLRERTKSSSKVQEAPAPNDWFSVAAYCESPRQFLQSIAPSAEIQTGWNSASFAHVGEYTPLNGQIFPEPIYLACLSIDFPDGRLSAHDIAEELLMLPNGDGRVAGIAYTASRSDGNRYVRAFLREDGKLHATALVDAQLPGSRATRQVRLLAKAFENPNVSNVITAFSAESLQRQFHEEISAWFLDTAGRRSELRHLIRILFVWLLQERGVVPDDTLWQAEINWRELPEGSIHDHILWLFEKILPKPMDARSPSTSNWRAKLILTVPFLNGSLFTELKAEDQPEPLANAQYVDLEQGLFSILGRYDWTLSERTGYATESAIDASMLGDLFERLILVTDGPRIEPDDHIKMPGGTYYTPQDIADEMVADALSGWTERKVGGDVSLHDLFHPAPRSREWENLTGRQLLAILKALEGANILDPCCGSGVFTVAALQGLWRARKRLLLTLRTSGDLTERTNSLDDIIEHNLFATDIHPLAVLITRLRIFIALVDIRGHELKPLPNLDTRIVAANTLCVNLGGQLSIEDPGIKGLIGDLGAVREAWTTAYRPEDKKTVLNLDGEIRAKIHNKSDWGSDDESEWLAVDLLYPAAPPANMDIRLLFPKPDGWDIVIGNPPYQQPDLADTFRGKRLSYIGAKTNLYLMFMEAALNVARRGGVVTLIVPHSIIFQRSAKAYERVRNRIEHLSERVDIRTYDNRPQPVFPQLPWLKAGSDKTNRQRVTIVRILLSGPDGNSEQCAIYSRGLLRLSSKDRLRVLRSRLSPQLQPRTPGQWTQAPTRDLALLLKLMREEKPMITSGRRVTISKSAMYFITCLPAERLANPSRKQFFLARDEFYWAWIGLYNSHLFHAYWLMMGNHMDLTSNTYASVRSPEGWNDKALLAKTTSIAKMLTSPAMIGKCRKVYRGKGGKEFPNCDFHDHPEGEALIEKLDRLLLQAYGLPEDPLLSQMHTIRTGSAHQLQKSAPSYNQQCGGASFCDLIGFSITEVWSCDQRIKDIQNDVNIYSIPEGSVRATF